MAAIMTKQGNLDNIVTYEHICDTFEDIQTIDPHYITLGSTCVVINGESGGLEVYMANSEKEWMSLSIASDSGEGSSSLGIQILGSNDYDSETGIPTISEPLENIFYLVPSNDDNNNMYNEWVYVNNNWELFGSSRNIDISNKVDKIEGKGLSTNDYTTAEKSKLSNIEAGAQVNTVTGIKGDSEAEYRVGNVNITKANIGLGSVDNISDVNKPISNQTKEALNKKIGIENYKGVKAYKILKGSSITYNSMISNIIDECIVYGKSIQNGTPNPLNPVAIQSAYSDGSIIITNDNNIITIPMSTPLLGIPVISGGNYIDSNGQHWICDTIDKVSGKHIRRVEKKTFSGTNATYNDNHNYIIQGISLSPVVSSVYTGQLCDRFVFAQSLNFVSSTPGTFKVHVTESGGTNLYIHAPDGVSDSAAAQNWMAENPVTVMYPLAVPVETDLTLNQLAALDKIKATNGSILLSTNDSLNTEIAIGIQIEIPKSLNEEENIYFKPDYSLNTRTVYINESDAIIIGDTNTRYICGEVSTLEFTPSTKGISSIQFTSGSSKTILTIPNTVKMPDWFEVEANTTYEISIADGVYGVVTSWAV